MPNGKLDETLINFTCLKLLQEWDKQEKAHHYKVWRLRPLFALLARVLVTERDRVQLLLAPPKPEIDPRQISLFEESKAELDDA